MEIPICTHTFRVLTTRKQLPAFGAALAFWCIQHIKSKETMSSDSRYTDWIETINVNIIDAH